MAMPCKVREMEGEQKQRVRAVPTVSRHKRLNHLGEICDSIFRNWADWWGVWWSWSTIRLWVSETLDLWLFFRARALVRLTSLTRSSVHTLYLPGTGVHHSRIRSPRNAHVSADCVTLPSWSRRAMSICDQHSRSLAADRRAG